MVGVLPVTYSLFIVAVTVVSNLGETSSIRKCADPLCKEKISIGRTTQRYLRKDEGLLSFQIDEEAIVYSKDAGENFDLWGVEIKGQRGYIPQKFLREHKVFVKHLIPVPAEKNETKFLEPSSQDGTDLDILNEDGPNPIENLESLPPPSEKESNSDQTVLSKGNVVSEDNKESVSLDETLKPLNNIDVKSTDSQLKSEPNIATEKSKESIVRFPLFSENNEVSEQNPASDAKAEEEMPDKDIGEIGKNANEETLLQIPKVIDDDDNTMGKEIDGKYDTIGKEMDNEDEGNGNEGEENGSEYDLHANKGHDGLIEDNSPSGSDGLVKNSEPFHSFIPPHFDPPQVIKSEGLHPESSTIPETDSVTITSVSDGDVPQPTLPVSYEVVEGTTVYSYDSDILVSSTPSFDELDASDLQTSQTLEEHIAQPTATISNLLNLNIKNSPGGNPKDDLNLASDPNPSKTDSFMSQTSEDKTIKSPNSSEDLRDNSEAKDKITEEESKIEQDSQSLGSETSKREESEDFTSPKPESILEVQEIQNEHTTERMSLSGTLGSLLPFIYSSSPNSEEKQEESNSVDDTVMKEADSDSKQEPAYVSNEESKMHRSDGDVCVSEDHCSANIASFPFIDPEGKHTVREIDKSEGRSEEESVKSSVDVDEVVPELKEGEPQQTPDVSQLKEYLLEASAPILQWLSQTFKMDEGMALSIEGELAHSGISSRAFVLLLLVALTIVTLYFSHLFMVKTSRESPLLEMMNQLDRKQRILTQENIDLKRKMCDSNGQTRPAERVDPVEMHTLREELENVKIKSFEEIEELKDRNEQLENDLEASTTNEAELHRMLHELLNNQKETSTFEDSVNSLQIMLDGQKEVVESLSSDLALKTRMNDELRNELKLTKSKSLKLEYQIEQVTHSLEEVSSSKQELMKKLSEEMHTSHYLKESNDTLVDKLDVVSRKSRNQSEEITKLKHKLASKEAECQVSKECLKKMQVFSNAEGTNDIQSKMNELFKIVEVKTQLANSESERDAFKATLEERESNYSTLSVDFKHMESENSRLREELDTIQAQRDDAKAKLVILSQHYEEKEALLKKELESQEELLHSAEGSTKMVSNRNHTFEKELSLCKSQIEGLKNELEEQKQSHKIQIANQENKLHESWLEAKALKRRQEVLQQENSLLRQRITHMVKDSADQSNMLIKPPPKRIDANGSISSPIPMDKDMNPLLPPMLPPLDLDGHPNLPPPPMLSMFPLPPPPPMHPHLFGHLPPHPPMPDGRLPPAGRIASPPGYDRRSYSPASDRSHYSDHHYSPGTRYSPNHHHHRLPSPDRKLPPPEHSRRNVHASRRGPRSVSPQDNQRHSPPERWYNRSPHRFENKHRRSPPPTMDYYDTMNDNRRMTAGKGKKTSTPLGPNDR